MYQIYDEIADPYKLMMAKSDPDNDKLWLPLWMHLADTAGVMRMLADWWTPVSVINACGLDMDGFKKTAVFTAAVHDIGKATSYFQSIIANPRSDLLTEEGMKIRPVSGYRFAGKTPHSYAGQWILQSETTGIGIPSYIADVVGAHHGKPYSSEGGFREEDLLRSYEINFYGEENDAGAKIPWKKMWDRFVKEAFIMADLENAGCLPSLNTQAQVLLSGLLIVADWIASNTEYFPLISKDDLGDKGLYPARVKEGCRKVSFSEKWNPETIHYDEELFKNRFGFMPNDVQKAVLETVESCKEPGVFILEAQMGIGKTEAGLAAAEILAADNKAGGIFFGLPTQATSNGLFPRLYTWAGSVSENTAHSIRLAHGAAEFNDDYSGLTQKSASIVDSADDSDDKGLGVHPWFQGNKRALLADFVIGTVDQFLMASLRRKHFMLRHLGLAGKIVIIDECHAYDAYMNRYLDRSLEWMAAYGVPVILLSATLPAKRRCELVLKYAKAYSRYNLGQKHPQKIYEPDGDWKNAEGYPLLTWTDGENICQKAIEQEVPHKEIKIETVSSREEMINRLGDTLIDGGCACIILNTVKDAQEVYELVIKMLKDVRVILYHAQFTMPDRSRKEQELLKYMGKHSSAQDRRRCILIGTQVLEQSLDYDADIMVTQLCPMDLLLQRMGRLQRHERPRPKKLKDPTCLIMIEGDGWFGEGTEAVYGRYLLMRTREAMRDHITFPEDIPALVQKVYRDDPTEESDDLKQAYEEFSRLQKEKKQRAENYLLKKPSGRRGSIENILVNADETPESAAECSVRDGTSSIEVLLMKKICNKIAFIGDGIGAKTLDTKIMPDGAAGRKIAQQRLRLPHIFAAEWNREKIIDELEEKNRKELAAWNDSPWLRGQLILLLDEDQETSLGGYHLSYSMEMGLTFSREE